MAGDPPGRSDDDIEIDSVDLDDEPVTTAAPALAPAPAEPEGAPPILDVDSLVEDAEDAISLDPDEGPSILDAALADAASSDPRADLALYEAEAAAEPDKGRMARLSHEAGSLHDRVLGSEGASVKAYAKALTLDPTFRANIWALRRVFARRQLWDSLLKLYDAEVRFAPVVSSADKADLLVERGRLLEDHMGRDEEAAASFRAALETAPDHAAALLSLLLISARLSDPAGAQSALAGLVRRTGDPGWRAAFTVEQARAQRSGGGDGAAESAAETLAAGLAAAVAAPGPSKAADIVLGELERTARQAGKSAFLLTAIDERVRRLGEANGNHDEDGALAAALLRQKAHILRSTAPVRDLGAAYDALGEALRRSPRHPLVLSDLLDVAEELGRSETASEVLERLPETVSLDERTTITLRKAEALARQGRPDEAAAALGASGDGAADGADAGAGDDAGAGLLMWAARVRYLAQGGDAVGLAAAFEAQAERALTKESGGRESRAAGAFELVRAAAVRHHVLRDADAAEALYRRALAVSPDFRPAVDGLMDVLAQARRFRELAVLLESVLPSATGEQRRHLRETLVATYRDELGDRTAALPHQQALADEAPEDARSRFRLADLHVDGATSADGVESLVALASHAGTPRVEAALRIEAARRSAETGDRARAGALFSEAMRADPLSLAGAGRERLAAAEKNVDEQVASLTAEIDLASPIAGDEIIRALRYRLAYTQAAAGRWVAAVGALEPLRRAGDALAAAWSYDLCRRSGLPSLEVAVLRESPDGQPLAFAEALEALGDDEAAREAFGRASEGGGQGGGPDAALGLLRLAVGAVDPAGIVEALRRLAGSVDGAGASDLRREADLLGAAARLPVAGAPPPPGAAVGEAAVLDWIRAVTARDGVRVAADLETFAAASDPETAVALHARAAARARFLAGAGAGGGALDAYLRGLDVSSGPPPTALLVGLTDLPGGTSGLPSDLPDVRGARADRVAGALGADLHKERAEELESCGHLREAAAAFGKALALDPTCLMAVEGVRRLANAAGDVEGEARALARLASLITTPSRAAQIFAEAALLFEDQNQHQEAARLYWEVLQRAPDDQEAYQRLHRILAAGSDHAGIDRLLGHKIARVPESAVKVPFYAERAEHRLLRLANRRGAAEDLQRILRIDPEHLESLHKLARLAIEARRFFHAAALLERYLAAARDDDEAAPIHIELAGAYEQAGDVRKAVAALRAAADARPGDAAPLSRLADLYTNARDWPRALETLRAYERCAAQPREKAEAHRRIAAILRDHRRDAAGAAAALEQAFQLDPLGEGVMDLCALYAETGKADARARVLDRAAEDLRRAVLENPQDVVRVERLRELLQMAGAGDAAGVIGQALALLGSGSERGRPRDLARPIGPDGFRSRLAHPASRGLLGEVWPLLAEAASRMRPVDPAALGATRQNRVAPGAEPRLGWVEAAARAFGFPRLAVHVGGADAQGVSAVDFPEPTLVLGSAILAGDAACRYRVGRALGVLRERAAGLESLPVGDLGLLFAAAAVTAGGVTPPGFAAAAVEERARLLSRTLGRKEKKALLIYVGRFAAEPIDASVWRQGVLRTADRMGLLCAGDVAAACRGAAAHAGGAGEATSNWATHPDALDLLTFALGEDYLALRREAGLSDREKT